MIIRKLQPEDRLAVGKLHSMCYLSKLTQEDIDRYMRESASAPLNGIGAFTDAGEIASVVLNNRLKMNFEGESYDMAGVGGVATHPAYRRGGIVRDLIKALLTQARAEGAVFSGLYPFNHAFYRKFGYELGRTEPVYTIKFSQLSRYAADFCARLLLPEDDYAPLLPVYEAFASRYNLAIARDEKRMNNLLKSNPYLGNKFTYILEQGGTPRAYVSYLCEREEGENFLNVQDYAFSSSDGFQMILGFLYRLSAEFSNLRIALPDDIPLPALVESPYDAKCTLNVNYMIRVLNCKAALEGICDKIAYGAQNSFVIDIQDDFLPENTGRYRLIDGRVTPTDAPADAAMSIQAFSQLVSGYLSFDSALLRSDVHCTGNAGALAHAFVKKPVFTGVYF